MNYLANLKQDCQRVEDQNIIKLLPFRGRGSEVESKDPSSSSAVGESVL